MSARERRDERQRDDIAHTELDVPSMPDAPHPVGVEQDVERDAGYDKIEHRRATVQLAHDRSRDEHRIGRGDQQLNYRRSTLVLTERQREEESHYVHYDHAHRGYEQESGKLCPALCPAGR